jgi:hypothetical protein
MSDAREEFEEHRWSLTKRQNELQKYSKRLNEKYTQEILGLIKTNT